MCLYFRAAERHMAFVVLIRMVIDLVAGGVLQMWRYERFGPECTYTSFNFLVIYAPKEVPMCLYTCTYLLW